MRFPSKTAARRSLGWLAVGVLSSLGLGCATGSHAAAKNGQTEVLLEGLKLHPEWLDRCARCDFGAGEISSPLGCAAYRGRIGTMKALIAAGAHADARCPEAPIRLAIRSMNEQGQSEDALRLPLDAGASVAQRGQWGDDPLVTAVVANQPQAVRLLLAHGADPNRVDAQGYSPISAAKKFDCQEILQILEKAAKPAQTAAASTGLSKSAGPGPSESAEPFPRSVRSDVDEPRFRDSARPDDFALVVGAEQYDRLPRADYAGRDADAVRKHLSALGLPDRNIILLTNRDAVRSRLTAYRKNGCRKT